MKGEYAKPLEPLHPSLLLHVQYSIKILYVPVLIKQYRSSPYIPTSPKYAQLRMYFQTPLTATESILNVIWESRTATYISVWFFDTKSMAFFVNDQVLEPARNQWWRTWCCRTDLHILDLHPICSPNIWLLKL